MKREKNDLWEADKQLFASMKTEATTPEEVNFFKNMQYKEEYEPSLVNDLIMSENNNEDNIYLVRSLYDEYLVGVSSAPEKEIHVMNLSEALNLNLKEAGLLDKDETLLQWLRARNYKGVEYNHNYDCM